MPWAIKRSFQRMMVGAVVCNWRWTVAKESPSASENEPGSKHVTGRKRTQLRDRREFVTLGVSKDQISEDGHTDIHASRLLTFTLRQSTSSRSTALSSISGSMRCFEIELRHFDGGCPRA